MMEGKGSGGRVRGKPRLGWMDGVNVTLGSRRMTFETVRQCAKHGKEFGALSICRSLMVERNEGIFLCLLCSLGSSSCGLVAYHLERGEMPLHDAVGVNCEKGAIILITRQRCLVCGLGGECSMIVSA